LDKTKLTEIVIAAVIATIIRELFTLAIRHSIKLIVELKKIIINILKTKVQHFLIASDFLIIVLLGYNLFKYISNPIHVTSSDVVTIAMNCIFWIYWWYRFGRDTEEYKQTKKK
jgi:hypothetical protein